MCKTKLLFKEIVNKHHKDFSDEKILAQVEMHPKIFNIEHLIELTMAYIGGYNFIDAAHCDFDDGTECKTASVGPNPTGKGRNSYRVEISNIITPGGNMKTGDVRCVVYNPHTTDIEYFYIPVSALDNEIRINRHPTTGTGRIIATWNRNTKRIAMLEPYRVETFEKLAKMKTKQGELND